jgi:serine/threonine protein phosphatase PrpC
MVLRAKLQKKVSNTILIIMSAFTSVPSIITPCSAVKQGRAKQDYTCNYSARDGSIWLIAIDGHGSHTLGGVAPGHDYVSWLSKLDWGDMIERYGGSCLDKVQEMTRSGMNTCGIGACIVLARIDPGRYRVNTWWKGDAECRVYADGKEIYRTKPHKMEKQSEKERYEDEKIVYSRHPGFSIQVLNGSQVTMQSSSYITWPGYLDRINISNSLGHNGITGRFIEEGDVELPKGAEIAVVVGSDGMWDMVAETDVDAAQISLLAKDAEALVSWAEARWDQEWFYTLGSHSEITRIPSRDDISVSTWVSNNSS